MIVNFICLGVRSIEHGNFLGEKNHLGQRWSQSRHVWKRWSWPTNLSIYICLKMAKCAILALFTLWNIYYYELEPRLEAYFTSHGEWWHGPGACTPTVPASPFGPSPPQRLPSLSAFVASAEPSPRSCSLSSNILACSRTAAMDNCSLT